MKWSKNSLFNRGYWEIWTATCKKNETQLPTYTIHKNKLKMDKRLNICHDTIKVLEENIGRKISDIPHSSIFPDMSTKARDIKERINNWDFIKIKSFWMAKENSTKLQREPTVWENIFANDTSYKDLTSKIYEELTWLQSRKTNNPTKKWAKDLSRHFSKEDILSTQRHMKGCLASPAIREMQIKSTMRCHFTLVKIAIITKSINNLCWRRCGEENPSTLLVGMQTVENSMEFPQKTKNGTAFWPGNSTAWIIP